jgi:hypothetical protein
MYKIVHKQHGSTGFILDCLEEAMELLELLLKKEPKQYYVREIQ